MRVAVYHHNRDLRIEERQRPAIGRGELLLRVRASGLCGSDAMEWYRVPKAPVVLGHEVAGQIEEVGPGVEHFAVGDRVIATHHVPCGHCRYCATDREPVCETLRRTSFDPGGFAELVRLPAINVERGTIRLPDEVSFEEGSFVEPLACVVRSQRIAGVREGDNVAVLGAGISGILQIQQARVQGAATILATDVNDWRLSAARRYGADIACAADADAVAALRQASGGKLADQVIVCAGVRRAFDQALELVDDGGTILYFAPLEPGETFPLPSNDLWKRCISLVHSYAGPPADMRMALELIAAGKIDVRSMVTHRLGLSEIQTGFDLLTAGGDSLKVIIEPDR